jgi:hypothetical protein
MPTVHKALNDDGSFTIYADGQPVRSVSDSAEADEVMRSLSYLVPEEDDPVARPVRG